MPDKIVVDVFKDMRELSRQLVTDEDERYLTNSFLLSYEGVHANQWVFILGALVPASQDIHPQATVELRNQLLIGSNCSSAFPLALERNSRLNISAKIKRRGNRKRGPIVLLRRF